MYKRQNLICHSTFGYTLITQHVEEPNLTVKIQSTRSDTFYTHDFSGEQTEGNKVLLEQTKCLCVHKKDRTMKRSRVNTTHNTDPGTDWKDETSECARTSSRWSVGKTTSNGPLAGIRAENGQQGKQSIRANDYVDCSQQWKYPTSSTGLRHPSSIHGHNWLRHRCRNQSANGQLFVGAEMAVSL